MGGRPTVRAGSAGLIVALLLGTAGCGRDEPPASAAATETSAAGTGATGDTATDATAVDPTATTALPTPPSLANPVGLFHDSEMRECTTAPGPVQAVGTTTNSGADAADIVVRVTWVTVEGSHVLVRNFEVFEDVGAGETIEWTIAADLPAELAAGQAVECALNVQRGSL